MDAVQFLKTVLVGAGGHGRILAEMLGEDPAVDLVGVVDPAGVTLPGLPNLGGDEVLPLLAARGICQAALGVGAIDNPQAREALFHKVRQAGLRAATVVSPWAYVSPSAVLGEGCQVLPMAVVHTGARVGPGTIVYSGAIVEHDCRIGSHCLIAPRAALAADVVVGDGVHIGIGACVRQGIRIAAAVVIGAGAVVVSDIEAAGCYVGVPARRQEKNPKIRFVA